MDRFTTALGENTFFGVVLGVLGSVLYHTCTEGMHGSSIGKRLFGLTVVSEEGGPCSLRQGWKCSLAFLLDSFTAELGHQAHEAGWAVFRVQGRLRSDSLEQLADHLRPGTPALLLVDYVEAQPAYEEVLETLNLLVDERQIPLRYIACCRSSFYSTIQLIGSHRRIDLFPQEDAAGGAWLEGFRHSAVRHIVEKSGVPFPSRVVEMSRATPVLAVFAAWLHDRGRRSDLHELLGEPDFGTWVHKRVRQSFPDPSAAAKLGLLFALWTNQRWRKRNTAGKREGRRRSS